MEKELKKGEYVTTVINNSNEFGLVFILGRVESVNINAEKVVLNMYDFFYRPIYRKLKLSYYECPIKYVYRCKARNGALVWIPDEKQYGNCQHGGLNQGQYHLAQNLPGCCSIQNSCF